ncbi:MAG: hypothetical protein A3H28_10435 [Acidobacteria bacterium RIFCSPLOWO2_02_FULL_61_28]|nr:MAG: hypothetical protein A3H28_10435 [Acidobacteria bacterium RIFCSPLOWO2_02_FULL_61_28]
MSTSASERDPSPTKFSGRLETATAVLTGLATCAILFSIAASQILLGAALLALLLSRRPIYFPARFGLALLAFLAWTILSLAFSRDLWAGFPHLRKFFVYFAVVVAYNAYQEPRQIWRTTQGIALGGVISALYGLAQFVLDYWRLREQGLPFYESYVVHQITGFMSHWMTFSGQLMMVLLLVVSGALFGGLSRRMRLGAWLCAAVVTLALLAAFTRGVWLGAFAGVAYLLARSQRRLLWLLPVALLGLYLLSPPWLQRRSESIFDLGTDTSNQSRVVMFWTGLRMIAAHPWFGVGPEQVGAEFPLYKPGGMPLPRAWYGHLHNNFLQLAAERGIPCLLLWLWMIFEVVYASLSFARSRGGEARTLGHSVIAITIGLMISGLFEFNFGDSEVVMLYLFLVSVPFAWARLGQQALPAPLSPQPLPASRPGPSALPQTP